LKERKVIKLKKHVSILIAAIFLISAFSFMKTSFVKADSPVVHVPADYPTIQDAVDSAYPGTTILVAKGTYIEHFNISKSLSLVGEDRDKTIIDGSDSNTVISITADNVAIQNFTIIKSVSLTFDTGIGVDRAKGILIGNTKIANIYTGLAFYSSANDIVDHNTIINGTSGIVLLYSNNNLFSDNIFYGNAQGISVYYSTFCTFAGNTFSSDPVDVFLASTSNRNYFYQNNFEDLVQVSPGSFNTWSRGNEGNYWSSYNFTGQDTDNDGIGQKPFRIDNYNMDSYPLMGPYAEYDISFAGTNYLIAIISNSTISNLLFEIGKETGNKIIQFNTSGENGTTGFCRMMIPTSLMSPPFTVEGPSEPLSVSLLNVSNETDSYLYFSYPSDDATISVIYSQELQLYNQLLDQYGKLQANFSDLNSTYQSTLANYTTSYGTLLDNFNALLSNLTRLQNDLLQTNSSLRQNLLNQSENAQNFRNLTYVFATLTAAFLITTVYLSSRLYITKKPKTYHTEE
jgi:parallel beta-helix repeat protein